MKWQYIVTILCIYGVCKEFKPIEPYLFRYQQTLGISDNDLNSKVYPFWTYSYLIFLLPALFLTDCLLYKPILILESLSYITVWILLIYGRSLFFQQIMQIIYGCATATEIAYFAYIYVKVDSDKYARVTIWTRAALQAGKCFAYFSSQIIIMTNLGGYLTLNYISLVSVSCMLIFALCLPSVHWRDVITDQSSACGLILNLIVDLPVDVKRKSTTLPISYNQFVMYKINNFFQVFRNVINNTNLLKWVIWWALSTCGDLQIGNYIQALWNEAQKDINNENVYNGFVEGAIPLLNSIVLILMQNLQINWSKWGEICLIFAASIQAASLLLMTFSNNIYVMYVCYAVFRLFYQCAITITQLNIVRQIAVNTCGFIFGISMLFALVFQTILTFVFIDNNGFFMLNIRGQFLLYSGYHLSIAAIFFGFLIARFIMRQ